MLTDVTAFAPATVANVGIGFDILGHTVEAVGDKVRLRRIDEPAVRIRSITGIAGDLPVEPMHNTAGRAVQAMHAALALDFGFEMDIEKGIPLGSGLGGSAASAVAAVVAANALLHAPLPKQIGAGEILHRGRIRGCGQPIVLRLVLGIEPHERVEAERTEFVFSPEAECPRRGRIAALTHDGVALGGHRRGGQRGRDGGRPALVAVPLSS